VPPKLSRRSMSHLEFFRLCEHLRTHREWVLRESPYLSALADKFSDDLKVQVTVASIKKAQEATGITWESPAAADALQGAAAVSELSARVNDLAGAVTGQAGQIDQIAGTLADHAGRFGQFGERVSKCLDRVNAAEEYARGAADRAMTAAGKAVTAADKATAAATASHDLDKEERDKLAAALAAAQRAFDAVQADLKTVKDAGHQIAAVQVDVRRVALAVGALYQRLGHKLPSECRSLFDALPPAGNSGLSAAGGAGLKGGLQ
jgi:ABC-type transporter Mla subunit MlaD